MHPDDIEYLTVADVIALYDVAMQESDQPASALVREDALRSAVHHPRNLGYYGDAGLSEQAVELMLHIASAHPWVDGNKRIATLAFYAFLRKNSVSVPGQEALRSVADLLILWLSTPAEQRPAVQDELVALVDSWVR